MTTTRVSLNGRAFTAAWAGAVKTALWGEDGLGAIATCQADSAAIDVRFDGDVVFSHAVDFPRARTLACRSSALSSPPSEASPRPAHRDPSERARSLGVYQTAVRFEALVKHHLRLVEQAAPALVTDRDTGV